MTTVNNIEDLWHVCSAVTYVVRQEINRSGNLYGSTNQDKTRVQLSELNKQKKIIIIWGII